MKLRISLGFLLVLALVISTNLLDSSSFEIVKRSLSNIYEDRLVAYDLTYKMHDEVTKRKILLLKGEISIFKAGGEEFYGFIDETMEEYKGTKLTVKESEYLGKLSDRFDDLQSLEKDFFAADGSKNDNRTREQLMERTNKVVETLNVLAQIQKDEGRRQMILSDRAVKSGTFMSRFKIVCIVLIGFGLQFLLLFKPKRR